jgi:Leucine-rich repeat (LRR) protein
VKKHLLFLFIAFIGITIINSAKAQTYDPYAVQVINNLIANNGLFATPDAPETWDFATWNNEIPKKLIKMVFFYGPPYGPLYGDVSLLGLETLKELELCEPQIGRLDLTNCAQLKTLEIHTGICLHKIDATGCTQLESLICRISNLKELDIADCTSLKTLVCSDGKLQRLDIAHCLQLEILDCSNNNLTDLDIQNLTQLKELWCIKNHISELDLSCQEQLQVLICNNNCLSKIVHKSELLSFSGSSQEVSLILYKDKDVFNTSMDLCFPHFGNNAISYENGILSSSDSSAKSTSFSVSLVYANSLKLSGTMNFSYSTLGDTKLFENTQLKVYPNPVQHTFFVECENCNNIKLYDIFGKEVLSQNANDKTQINISHLPQGVYIVDVFSGYKNIGTVKIVKQ